jgi:hypothetical protein
VLPGFGKLVKSETKARQGRNPATGETIQIPARTKLKFRINKTLKEAALPTLPASPAPPAPAWIEPPDPPDGGGFAPAAELAGDSTKGNRP